MLRTLLAAAAVVSVVVLIGGAMLYLAYGLADAPPSEVVVAGLADSATVTAYQNGGISIRAGSRTDAFAALGYLHAQQHGWSMTLWQRTARGRLAAWFGEELMALDRLTRRLGLARHAEASYASLPAEVRTLLDAYVRGVNAAFLDGDAARAGEFSLLEIAPDRWEPWYPLAVERLYAWLATDRPPSDSLREAPSVVRDFYDSDRLLRRWLHVHGFDQSMAWTVRDTASTRLTQRHVYGATALPLYQEVEIRIAGSLLAGATLIGTPFMPAGRSGSTAWALLASSTTELAPALQDTAGGGFVHEKLETAEGDEYLLRFRTNEGEIFFPTDVPPAEILPPDTSAVDTAAAGTVDASTSVTGPDTTSVLTAAPAQLDTAATSTVTAGWVLRWAGLGTVSDAAAWLSMPGASEPFRLLDGDGIEMSRDGTTRVLGSPLFAYEHRTGVAIGNSPWSRYAAERLDSVSVAPGTMTQPAALSDVHSTWAAGLAPALANAAIAVPDQSALVIDALAYLRNWDYGYDRASIAASIFDTWAYAYRDSLGRLPAGVVADTVLGDNLVRYEILVKAVETLSRRHGDDPSQWRWEEVQPHRYYFPVWAADTVLAADVALPSQSRYAPITLPGAGHVSTLYHGPSRMRQHLEAPATWEGWVSTTAWETFRYRTRRFHANRFFGRYLVSDRIPEPSVISDTDETSFTTTLLPE